MVAGICVHVVRLARLDYSSTRWSAPTVDLAQMSFYRIQWGLCRSGNHARWTFAARELLVQLSPGNFHVVATYTTQHTQHHHKALPPECRQVSPRFHSPRFMDILIIVYLREYPMQRRREGKIQGHTSRFSPTTVQYTSEPPVRHLDPLDYTVTGNNLVYDMFLAKI